LIWIGTKGAGLNCLDKNTNKFTHKNSTDGLPNDFIYGLLSDHSGNIWGSTNRGIFCMERQNNQFIIRNFSTADGLQSDEFNTCAFLKLKNGNLAFGGVNGLNIFNPKEILAKRVMPYIYISKLLIGNNEILPNDSSEILKNNIQYAKDISLTHLQNVITLEFTSMDLTCPNQNKFRYKLEGIDNEWIESGTRRYATYLHLPPGKYKFRVEGTNSQGVWSKHSAILNISVLPPWWWSMNSKIMYLLLTLSLTYFLISYKIRQAAMKTQLEFERKEAERIKDLNLQKSIMYTNITHEFRTPLTIILGMTEHILNHPRSSNIHGIDMIKRNVKNLLNLVNDILDLSKLESGKLELKLRTGDIISYLKYLIEPFQWMAKSQNKGLYLIINIESLVIEYDSEKIAQIFNNLISNAIKFTPENNSVFIQIDEFHDHINNFLIINIRDSGAGISKVHLEQIFERYYNNSESETSFKGSGIGLALTKELINLINGEIIVNSPAKGFKIGSEFIVKIPINKIDSPSLPKVVEPEVLEDYPNLEGENFIPEENDSEKDLILLIEDNIDIIEYLSISLKKFNLVVAKDGQEGFVVAKEMIPNLIITDILMPNIDGLEMCKMIKNDPNTNHIPIIVITAKVGKQINFEALQNGADVYLEKPFQQEELMIHIDKLLSSRNELKNYYLNKFQSQNSMSTGMQNMEILNNEPIKDDPFISKAKLIIEQNLANPDFKIEHLCKLLFMSHSQIHRKLDALLACSPNKFIRLVRLEKAKELLKTNNQSIASIALECGYSDPAYFSRVFKQEFQNTPLEWREKNLN
jgi:signal transduction histidine kinase/DNA-binding response OmpR family regulator